MKTIMKFQIKLLFYKNDQIISGNCQINSIFGEKNEIFRKN
jgi:hypothetical protein